MYPISPYPASNSAPSCHVLPLGRCFAVRRLYPSESRLTRFVCIRPPGRQSQNRKQLTGLGPTSDRLALR